MPCRAADRGCGSRPPAKPRPPAKASSPQLPPCLHPSLHPFPLYLPSLSSLPPLPPPPFLPFIHHLSLFSILICLPVCTAVCPSVHPSIHPPTHLSLTRTHYTLVQVRVDCLFVFFTTLQRRFRTLIGMLSESPSDSSQDANDSAHFK